ncbi:hypothetical protein HY484_00705 [Candidatus Woesearchaeota archaeon]|nr:hypothetical protein [Candidatus Woesearchaeota archaeon]
MMRYVVAIMLVVLSVSVFAEIVTDYRLVPQHPRGVERVTNYDPRIQNYGWEEVVYLAPVEDTPIIARGYSERVPIGTARVSSTQYSIRNPNSPQAGATIKVRNLEATYDKYKGAKLYEGWLVDEDTGYWLSFGVFYTDNFGNGRLNTATSRMPEKQKLFHNIDFYDAVAVTLEDYPDSDPRPSGDVALYGNIVRKKLFVPEPTVQNKLQGVQKYYPTSSYANTVAQVPPEKLKAPERKYVYDWMLRQWVSR